MTNPSGAPVAFTIAEQEFLMSPLTDRDIQELNNFIKQDILKNAKEFCKTETNVTIIEATMKAAMAQVSKVDWIINSDLLQSVERISYLLWMGVRANAPKPTRAVFTNLLLSDWETNFDLCMETLQLANPFLLKRQTKEEVPVE